RDVLGAFELRRVVGFVGAISLIEARAKVLVENLVEKRRLPRARDPRNGHHAPQRHVNAEILYVKRLAAADFEHPLVLLPPLLWHLNGLLTPQVRKGHRTALVLLGGEQF